MRFDQTIVLTGLNASKDYPDPLRRISYIDPDTDKRLMFLTNNFTLPALTIPKLYKCRWQVELFFKWIKQYLRIKAFYGTSENAGQDTNLDRDLACTSWSPSSRKNSGSTAAWAKFCKF